MRTSLRFANLLIIILVIISDVSCGKQEGLEPTYPVCYVSKVAEFYVDDPSDTSRVAFQYDDSDRLVHFESRGYRSSCLSRYVKIADVTWDSNIISKIVITRTVNSSCVRATTEYQLQYTNGLVTSLGANQGADEYKFKYDSDSNLIEITFGTAVYTLGYDGERNMVSMADAYKVTEFTYDDKQNYLAPVRKALGDQPALLYFLTGVSGLSKNNILLQTDMYGAVTHSYELDNNGYAIEELIDDLGIVQKKIIEYEVCR